MKVEYEGGSFSIGSALMRELDVMCQDVVDFDGDAVLLVTGQEGAGKTVFSWQLASYISFRLRETYGVDSSFSLKNVHFELEEYMNAAERGGQYHINILDEGRKLLNKMRSMSKGVVHFTDWLSECRDNNQFHIICTPYPTDVVPYIINVRMSILFEVYYTWGSDPKTSTSFTKHRGKYKTFVTNAYLRAFYDDKYHRYSWPEQFKIRDRFSLFHGEWPILLKDYKEKKKFWREQKYLERDVGNFTPAQIRVIYDMMKNAGWKVNQEQIASLFNVSLRGVRKPVASYRRGVAKGLTTNNIISTNEIGVGVIK